MKRKAGLHKKISSIFDGVPIPKSDGHTSSGNAPQKEHPSASLTQNLPHAYSQHQQSPHETFQTKPHSALSSTTHPKQPVPPARVPQKRKTHLSKQTGFWHEVKVKLYGSPSGEVDPRQQKMTIITAVLTIVFICVLYSFFAKSQRQTVKNSSDSTIDQASIAAGDLEINWIRPKPYPANLRDPMKLGYRKSYGNDEMIITGIVLSDEPTAIIAGSMVGEGDTIFEMKVVRINESSVEFEKKDGTKFVRKVGERW